MKSKTTRGARVVAIVMMFMIAFSATSMIGFANDHTDRPFSFVFAQGNDHTNLAKKQDATPVCVRVMSSVGGMSAKVKNSYGTEVSGKEWKNCPDQANTFIPVTTYNPDWLYAVYAISNNPSPNSAAWGYWSPDSINS